MRSITALVVIKDSHVTNLLELSFVKAGIFLLTFGLITNLLRILGDSAAMTFG